MKVVTENRANVRKERTHSSLNLSDKLKCGFLDKEISVSGFRLQRYELKKEKWRVYKMAHM